MSSRAVERRVRQTHSHLHPAMRQAGSERSGWVVVWVGGCEGEGERERERERERATERGRRIRTLKAHDKLGAVLPG